MPCPAICLAIRPAIRRMSRTPPFLALQSPTMQRDPALPRRRSIRLPLFDYAQPYFYFITICSVGKECIFGHVEGREMFLNALGRLVDECWRQIPRHFPVVELAPHVVMPNHIHGIIRLRHATDGASVAKQLGRARHAVPLRPDRSVREFALRLSVRFPPS